MPFSQTDFDDNQTRTKLTVIINDKLGYSPLQKWSSLTTRQQKAFLESLKLYIHSLQTDETHLEKITHDFNEIMGDMFIDPKFKAEEHEVKIINSAHVELTKEDNLDDKLRQVEEKQQSISV
jgi:hypothetical protein